jgi:hypothetical protein
VSGPRGTDVKKVPGLLVLPERARIHIYQDHVVELEPLGLPGVGDLDAWAKRKILRANAARGEKPRGRVYSRAAKRLPKYDGRVSQGFGRSSL